MSATPLLALQGASVQYPQGSQPVLKDIDFALLPGERVGLMGPNGSGKTTLLLSLVGLVPLRKGALLLQGQPVRTSSDLARLRRLAGFVFQNPDDQLFSPTVLEDVAFGPLNQGLSQTEARNAALAMLDSLNLSHLAHRQPHTLSGGQKRLVCLATVLVMQPQALLLDEPTNDLDTISRELFLQALQTTPCAMIIASHDQQLLGALTSRRFALG
ncbi:cobalt/nickel transport system ATP-binding protein [Desulfonatronum thiosulfatophilum]|uniref:Cobalt/nickel transport system ATP-binding protein n=1 Tax=Desulfonatronum thiosulfatophilum TaxID=617002 RepID=A0A1G6D5V5_9BACT|nr:ABC transporter ATP-binding protein [Desulfonatronum thiosulfatophilum]SDB40449.1 cobalt/nickel transport system ATP-binding protein [Desulfonatronum thiosulfatophilum]